MNKVLDLETLLELDLEIDPVFAQGPDLYKRMWAYAHTYERCPICDDELEFASNMFCPTCNAEIKVGAAGIDNAEWLRRVLEFLEQNLPTNHCAQCDAVVYTDDYLCRMCRA